LSQLLSMLKHLHFRINIFSEYVSIQLLQQGISVSLLSKVFLIAKGISSSFFYQ
jgi:hypothetical protein